MRNFAAFAVVFCATFVGTIFGYFDFFGTTTASFHDEVEKDFDDIMNMEFQSVKQIALSIETFERELKQR